MNWRTRINKSENLFILGDSYNHLYDEIGKLRGEGEKQSTYILEFCGSDNEWVEIDKVEFLDTGEIQIQRGSHLTHA